MKVVKIFIVLLLFSVCLYPVDFQIEPHAKHAKTLMKEFGVSAAKENNLTYASCSGSMWGVIENLSVNFYAYRKSSIEEARNLEIKLVEQLLTIINNDDKIRDHLKIYPFTADKIHIRVSFIDRNEVVHQSVNSIAAVMTARGVIHYSKVNPKTENLEVFYKESYEDARKKIKGEMPDIRVLD